MSQSSSFLCRNNKFKKVQEVVVRAFAERPSTGNEQDTDHVWLKLQDHAPYQYLSPSDLRLRTASHGSLSKTSGISHPHVNSPEPPDVSSKSGREVPDLIGISCRTVVGKPLPTRHPWHPTSRTLITSLNSHFEEMATASCASRLRPLPILLETTTIAIAHRIIIK
jgi:hypothetical protein